MIRINEALYNEMLAHAVEIYPHECCGVLLGKGSSEKEVVKVRAATNINEDRAADRYSIDPKELYDIDKEARGEGLDILGFYHSHPDHPSKPSETDREWGQACYSYIIISVMGGEVDSVRSWSFEDFDDPFSEEELLAGGA